MYNTENYGSEARQVMAYLEEAAEAIMTGVTYKGDIVYKVDSSIAEAMGAAKRVFANPNIIKPIIDAIEKASCQKGLENILCTLKENPLGLSEEMLARKYATAKSHYYRAVEAGVESANDLYRKITAAFNERKPQSTFTKMYRCASRAIEYIMPRRAA